MFAALNNNLRIVGIVLFFSICFIGTACCADSLKGKDWYKFAEEYIKLDQTMNMNIIQKKESFADDYSLLITAEAKILNSPPPTADELLVLLNSNDNLDQRIALVNMMIRPADDEKLVKQAIKLNDPFDNYFRKFYSYIYFLRLNEDAVEAHEDELINLIKWEPDRSLVIKMMPFLTRLDPSKVLPLFKDYLKREDRGVKRIAFLNLKKWGDKYMSEVKKQLEMENAAETLKFIEDLEAELEAQPK